MLNICLHDISFLLSFNINESFLSGIYLGKMQQAMVLPSFKRGYPMIASKYRPLSLLSIFSKIMEKLIWYRRLYNFLEIYKILYNLQFGFCVNHSIDHTLICMTESIKTSLDNKRYGCGIYLDLQQEFDLVNHWICLDKLEHYMTPKE